MIDREALVTEALRVYRRYALEVVEEMNLCPWARRARRDGHVAERVVLSMDASTQESLEAIAEIASDDEVEIGLLLYPLVRLPRLEFEHFVGRIRADDESRYECGSVPFAMAAFHPDADADTSDPERMIPFIRRTPDPTIQLVRRSVLERVRAGNPEGTAFVDLDVLDARALGTLALGESTQPPLRERIARANLSAIEARGLAEVAEIFENIRRDRDEAYERLGVR